MANGTTDVDDAKMWPVHTALITAKTTVSSSKKSIEGMAIKAGNFADAADLESLILRRRGELVELLTNIEDALGSLADRLKAAIIKYKDTGDDTTYDAQTFQRELLELLNGDLPGFTKA